MQTTYSTMGLHLCYRLWIAELNAYVNVLRIFDDYIAEITLKSETDVKTELEGFKAQFAGFRKQIEQLTHDMHLVKMELGAKAKAGIKREENPGDGIHADIKARYEHFRSEFTNAKKHFMQFENEWLK